MKWDESTMEVLVWVFIYPVAVHRPCGHVCAPKNKSHAICENSHVSINARSFSPAVARQYDAGRADITLLRIKQQKLIGPCKHVVNYIYASNLTSQQSESYLIGKKVSNMASDNFDSFTAITYLPMSQI
jgi:hypothetical protein